MNCLFWSFTGIGETITNQRKCRQCKLISICSNYLIRKVVKCFGEVYKKRTKNFTLIFSISLTYRVDDDAFPRKIHIGIWGIWGCLGLFAYTVVFQISCR